MRLFFCAAVLLMATTTLTGCIQNSPVSEVFAPGKEKVAAAQTATVADFVETYRENSMKANSEYSGRWVKIRGQITSISKHDPFEGTGSTTFYFVMLKDDTGRTDGVITCRFNFNKSSDLKQLKTGDIVTFHGMIENMRHTNDGLPIITDCLVVK